MQLNKWLSFAILVNTLASIPISAPAQVTIDAPVVGRPSAIINLATDEGVKLVKGQWRYSDTKIIEVDHHSPGADLRPSHDSGRLTPDVRAPVDVLEGAD